MMHCTIAIKFNCFFLTTPHHQHVRDPERKFPPWSMLKHGVGSIINDWSEKCLAKGDLIKHIMILYTYNTLNNQFNICYLFYLATAGCTNNKVQV